MARTVLNVMSLDNVNVPAVAAASASMLVAPNSADGAEFEMGKDNKTLILLVNDGSSAASTVIKAGNGIQGTACTGGQARPAGHNPFPRIHRPDTQDTQGMPQPQSPRSLSCIQRKHRNIQGASETGRLVCRHRRSPDIQEGVYCRNRKTDTSRENSARDRLPLPHPRTVQRKEERKQLYTAYCRKTVGTDRHGTGPDCRNNYW